MGSLVRNEVYVAAMKTVIQCPVCAPGYFISDISVCDLSYVIYVLLVSVSCVNIFQVLWEKQEPENS